jgi:hypothetical protein
MRHALSRRGDTKPIQVLLWFLGVSVWQTLLHGPLWGASLTFPRQKSGPTVERISARIDHPRRSSVIKEDVCSDVPHGAR